MNSHVPRIRIRYVIDRNQFGYASFGDFFMIDSQGYYDLYVWIQDDKYAELHNQAVVEEYFGDECHGSPLREQIRELSKNKRVLNLFCYTASFSVFAAEGNAQYIESVDLSNTYLNWAKENLLLNGFSDEKKYAFKKEDAIKFLQKKQNSKYEDLFDIIILDPPTFSNSKSTENILDINRDWINLVNNSLNLLKKDGILFFSTNSTRLSFKEQNILKTTKNGFEVNAEDITPLTIPKDFEGTKCHKCWKLSCK